MSWKGYLKKELAVYVNKARREGNDDLSDLAFVQGMVWVFVWGVVFLTGLMLWMSFA